SNIGAPPWTCSQRVMPETPSRSLMMWTRTALSSVRSSKGLEHCARFAGYSGAVQACACRHTAVCGPFTSEFLVGDFVELTNRGRDYLTRSAEESVGTGAAV